MPVISTSTTSPAFRSGDAPSVPIQMTSPGHSVKYFVSSTMNGTTPKIMSLVRKRLLSFPFTLTMVSILSRSASVSIHGPIGLNVSAFLARHRPIGLLPRALADIVADGVAEDTGHRVRFVQMLDLLPDHHHQLALVVDF